MKIAVEGCAHGELEKIYETICEIEARDNIKIDLLLCCGDFQATRNMEDLQTMAVPPKFQHMCSFYKYYSGELRAPMLTIFIGGNHEASNYLQELPYGGWVAPNIYYLGYAGVVRVNGIRIAGLSGIYKGNDYLRGRFEFSPYTESTKRSVYHVRQFEVFRLKQLSGRIDIFMSHDWPRGIYNYGNKEQLVRFKPFLREEMDRDQLGSRPNEDLLNLLQPLYWFSAHLHCKFAAVVQHDESNVSSKSQIDNETQIVMKYSPDTVRVTKFLALDKCLPKRRFLQILDIDSDNHTGDEGSLNLEYDLEWLTIIYLTNHLMTVKESYYYLPNEKSVNGDRFNYKPTVEEMEMVRQKFDNYLKIPENFCRTADVYDPLTHVKGQHYKQPKSQINPQSLSFCDTLGIDDPLSLAMLIGGHELSHSSTLDNTEESTFNDSLLDEQLNNTSTNSFGCVSFTSPVKRCTSALDLPEPAKKTNVMYEEQCIRDNKPVCADKNNIEISPLKRKSDSFTTAAKTIEVHLAEHEISKKLIEKNLDIEEKEVDSSLLCSDDLDTIKTESQSKPLVKKFKRRNQNIYENKNDVVEENS